MTATLFRAKRTFVCDHCDLGYRAGRLAGYGSAGQLECATCLYGSDPDTETTEREHAHA